MGGGGGCLFFVGFLGGGGEGGGCNLTIEKVTFRLRGWCMWGVLLLPSRT